MLEQPWTAPRFQIGNPVDSSLFTNHTETTVATQRKTKTSRNSPRHNGRARASEPKRRSRRGDEEGDEAPTQRPIWKGSVRFGLVDIPVALVSAEVRNELSFRLLDRRDFSPVGYKRINKTTGAEVPWDEIVRGHEHRKGEYVVVTDEDLERANVEATQTIDILEFVPGKDIEPVYFETPYYLAPGRRSSKTYALLRAALESSGKVGIAKVVLRSREHLAALIVRGNALMLDLLRYEHEIRKPEGLGLPSKSLTELGVRPQEVDMAEKLIDGMSGKWQPSKYHDEYRDDLLALMEKKARSGRSLVIDETPPEKRKVRAEVTDLMPLLKKSLESRGKASRARSGAKSKRAARSA